jgi:hypothetical protein
MTTNETAKKEFSPVAVRIFYAAFVLFAVYFLVRGDVMSAASNLGIGLIFDPFKGTWQERKVWQKGWLLIHVTLVFVLFAFGIRG